MNIEKILKFENFDLIINEISQGINYSTQSAELQNVYDGKHLILERPNKVTKKKVTTTAKIVFNYQKKITESSVAFLFGTPVTILKTTDGGDNAFTLLKETLESLKFDSITKQVARTTFIQKRAAKLFYLTSADNNNYKLKVLPLDYTNGEFFANFSDSGDMDAFLRVYSVFDIFAGKKIKIDKFELYTATTITKGEKINKVWETTETKNIYGKIPVVYYQQEAEEWADVQTLIDSFELTISELVDTNQYFASPIIKLFGNVVGLPDKENQGKALNCEIVTDAEGNTHKSDAEYLTWNQRPESLKMQLDLIEKGIFSFSSTADISFHSLLANKPGNISGSALEFLMLDPILKSYRKQEIWMPGIKRELSVITALLSVASPKYKSDFDNMKFKVIFNSVLPNNLADVIGTLSQAAGNVPIISQETAVAQNPLVSNPVTEVEKLQKENSEIAGSFDI